MNELLHTLQKVLITGDNASTQFGGEAILPFHYFRLLNEQHIETWLVTHSRCQKELERLLPHLKDKMAFIDDSALDLKLYHYETKPQLRFISSIFSAVRYALFQIKQKQKIRELVRKHHIQLVHQVTQVSPKLPSFIYDVGAPVIIGPMNGGMEYPEGFKHLFHERERIFVSIGRFFSQFLNILIPGKYKASLLLVANERTRNALPWHIKAPVSIFVENGIDLNVWKPEPIQKHFEKDLANPIKFVFLGRLIDWKGVQYLINAYEKIFQEIPSELHIIGDGPERDSLEQQAQACKGKIIFHGAIEWQKGAQLLQQADVMILPSLLECGGAVVMEGMVCGLPVIATDWGGPADYLDEHCGILIKPTDEKMFVQDLSQAMLKLALSPELRYEMGLAGQKKAVSQFSWQEKIQQMIKIYHSCIFDS